MIWSAEKHFRRQVPPWFAALGALNADGLKGELPDAGWDGAAASLARDNECLAG